ncbi:PLC-like phosphodiesterase [Clohesyomyces aquaticus]|uniref:PLC-like phosphodiesterase n=1 Tax=Clohesyomyces aquaticus TaxID=1231657 RepID=A0A1Y1YFM6_9PLEO|nr:PLC-like phosphodiesterase [Clohesyomyces aquaticus]
MVVAHNSPFVVPHNAASNQVFQLIKQLDDGIRGLGPLEDYLRTVVSWLESHPYEVIAIMMGNDARVNPTNYIQPITGSGMLPYLFTPSRADLTLEEWPTLAEMIIENKRVVLYLDYLANQTAVPWLLDQFVYQWQTPFSPTDPHFPCTEQHPPNQAEDVSRNRMYMLGRGLDIAMTLSGMSILIPAYSLLDKVNAVSGNGSLGRNVEYCTAMWGRPPKWLLVDYYNFGNFNGSVFEVAAQANIVLRAVLQLACRFLKLDL